MKDRGVFISKRDVFEFKQIEKFLSGRQKRNETSVLLGQTECTLTRKSRRVESKGLLGIKHGNTGKRLRNKKSDLLKAHVFSLIRNEYFDYNMSHLQETLKSANGITVAYTTLRRWRLHLNSIHKRVSIWTSLPLLICYTYVTTNVVRRTYEKEAFSSRK